MKIVFTLGVAQEPLQCAPRHFWLVMFSVNMYCTINNQVYFCILCLCNYDGCFKLFEVEIFDPEQRFKFFFAILLQNNNLCNLPLELRCAIYL